MEEESSEKVVRMANTPNCGIILGTWAFIASVALLVISMLYANSCAPELEVDSGAADSKNVVFKKYDILNFDEGKVETQGDGSSCPPCTFSAITILEMLAVLAIGVFTMSRVCTLGTFCYRKISEKRKLNKLAKIEAWKMRYLPSCPVEGSMSTDTTTLATHILPSLTTGTNCVTEMNGTDESKVTAQQLSSAQLRLF